MPDFEEIYQTYFADVYRYILALSRDAHTAEEVTQETFFRALASIDQFRGDCQLRHDLPEPYKEVFSLRTFGELPFAQIGELFGKTESWARVTYFRARQKLKEGFDGPAGP